MTHHSNQKSTMTAVHTTCVLYLKTSKLNASGVPVAQWLEHCVSSAKVVGSIPREHIYWQNKKCLTLMHCKSLWIKASAKCINVNVNMHEKLLKVQCRYWSVFFSSELRMSLTTISSSELNFRTRWVWFMNKSFSFCKPDQLIQDSVIYESLGRMSRFSVQLSWYIYWLVQPVLL